MGSGGLVVRVVSTGGRVRGCGRVVWRDTQGTVVWSTRENKTSGISSPEIDPR